MKQINDGGHAFPHVVEPVIGNPGIYRSVTGGGMSLRDYFAGQALVGQLAFSPPDDPYNKFHKPEDVARMCFEFADAMIAARKAGAA
ncbi:hypothetical protein RJJ64_22060 [Rhizobium hidalgonense]|nr:hypothetical protein [Rhizobium hidalgonense]